MNKDEKLIMNIINEIIDLENALKRFNCSDSNTFLDDSHIKKIAAQTLINISESISYLSSDFKKMNREISWSQFKQTRNIAAHKYGAVNFFIVWQIIKVNLPIFKEQLLQLTQK